MEDNYLRDNPNKPPVRFIRVRGRIIPIVGKKPSYKAAKVLENTVGMMTREVDQAEAGHRIHSGYGTDHKVIGVPSTFPKFFRELHFGSKNEWMRAIKKKSGANYDAIVDKAKESPDFKIATKQAFDNYLVNYRTINHKVIPIRSKSLNEFKQFRKKSFVKVPMPQAGEAEFHRRFIEGDEVPF